RHSRALCRRAAFRRTGEETHPQGRSRGRGRTRRMKRWVSASILFCFTSACAVGPNYHRPKVSMPDHFRGQKNVENLPPDENSFADLPWWEVFQDPTLQELIRTALEN